MIVRRFDEQAGSSGSNSYLKSQCSGNRCVYNWSSQSVAVMLQHLTVAQDLSVELGMKGWEDGFAEELSLGLRCSTVLSPCKAKDIASF